MNKPNTHNEALLDEVLDPAMRRRITSLMNREVVPAIGCTEPVAVALAVSRACEALGCEPERIEVGLSGNVLKNAMGVGIPGTGMTGLPIAIALGALVGRSEYGLEVLRDVNADAVARGRRMIDERRIVISHLPEAPSKLHIEATVSAAGHTAKAVISGGHTDIVSVSRDGVELSAAAAATDGTADAMPDEDAPELRLATVWRYAMHSPLAELEFIDEARRLNSEASRIALEDGGMGHSVGSVIDRKGAAIFGDTVIRRVLARTASACDARMAGEPVAVMSNSGSGNQGITITMPVVAYAEEIGASHEQMIRALALAHLTSIYIKQSLGRLSALCGCVVASTGATMALTYLMGGDYRHCTYSVKNMIANLTGMICDGAKPACALKIASGVSTAMISALMSMEDRCVTSTEGIVEDDVDATIENLTSIGRDAMNETDRLVLAIMSRH